MKLNLKQLLTLAFFFGSVNCTANSKVELVDKIKKQPPISLDDSTRKNMIHALENPGCLFDSNDEVIDDVNSIKNDCHDDHAHDFYRLIFKDDKNGEKLAQFSDYCKTNANLDNPSLKDEMKTFIKADYEKKKKFLRKIIYSIPVIEDYKKSDKTDFSKIIESHIEKFIEDALVYDGKRLTYSSLHKTMESIKNAYIVNRKAKHGIEAVIKMLESTEEIKLLEVKEGFKIKMAVEDKKVPGTTTIKAKNILAVAVKASDKSTSSPQTLFFVLMISLILSASLLVYKAYNVEESMDEVEF